MVRIKSRLACEGQGAAKALRAHKRRTSIPRIHALSFSFLLRGLRQGQEPRRKTRNSWEDTEHILAVEFDYTFATDIPGDPNRKVSMMVASDSIHGSILVGWQGRLFETSFSKLHRQVGSQQGRVGMWPGAKYSWYCTCFDQVVPIHESCCDFDAKRFERDLGAWRKSKFDNPGTVVSISWSHFIKIQNRYWIWSRAEELDGSAQCIGREPFSSERIWENAIS